MARSIKKGPYVANHLVKKVEAANDRTILKTWSRRSTIVPEFVGRKVMIHNGKDFVTLLVTENMVGHKLGEFAPTRKFIAHAGDRKGKVEEA